MHTLVRGNDTRLSPSNDSSYRPTIIAATPRVDSSDPQPLDRHTQCDELFEVRTVKVYCTFLRRATHHRRPDIELFAYSFATFKQ